MHQAEHRDDGNVSENLQYNRPLDTGGRADRIGLCEAGPVRAGRQHPRNRRVLQHRRFLRP